MARLFVLALVVALVAAPVRAQKPMTPTETVRTFYRLLREQRYVEGFSYSIYREAIEGLSAEDLAELTPDFQEAFADIPETIDFRGEQISGEVATVFAGFGASDGVDEITLVKEDGRWLVGDRESLDQVRRERTAFFFNTRMRVNHNQVYLLVKRILSAEDLVFQMAKQYATIDELKAKGIVTEEFKDGVLSGYRFLVNLTPDRRAFTVIAFPVAYGRTGQLSFFADQQGNVHGADAKGLPVNETAPRLEATDLAPAGRE